MFAHAWVEPAIGAEPDNTEPPPRLLQHLLDEAVDRWPARPAIEFMGKLISYRELGALVDHAAQGLQDLGVGPGVRVALHLPVTPHVAIASFAVLKAGGTLVDCSALEDGPALREVLEASCSEMLITLAARAWYEPTSQALRTAHLRTVVVGTLAQFAAQPDAVIAAQRRNGDHVDVPVDGRHVRFGQLLRNQGLARVNTIETPVQAPALLRRRGGRGHELETLTHTALWAALRLGNASTLIDDMLLCVQSGALQLLGAHDRLVLNRMVARPNCRSN